MTGEDGARIDTMRGRQWYVQHPNATSNINDDDNDAMPVANAMAKTSDNDNEHSQPL